MTFELSNAGHFNRFYNRIIGLVGLLVFCTFAAIGSSLAHEGHDHGDDDKKVEEVEVADPRFAVETALFQLVGHAQGQKLTLYLDQFADNAPVETAVVDVTAGADNQIAEEVSPGTYELIGEWVGTSGTHDLIVSVAAGTDADLILAQLIIPEPESEEISTISTWWESYLPSATHAFVTPPLTAISVFFSEVRTSYLFVGIFGVGLILGLLIRNTVFPVSSAAIALALLSNPVPTHAHEGHDHGEDQTPVVQTGNQPRRLADGSVFLPKPTQRLLKVRSQVVELSDVPQTQRLLGKTIFDPAHRGVVQAVRDGRIGFPPRGLPTIGETVKIDDVVATLTPVLTPEAQAGMTEQLGALTQEIAVTKQRLSRLQAVAQVRVVGAGGGLSAVSRGSIEELEVQLETLEKRSSALSSISFGSLDLKASRSGTIANVNVTTGQVVAAGDTLIEIVDPKRIWVEAVAYPGQQTSFTSKASAVLPKNGTVPISFISRSLSLTAQAETLFFRLEKDETVPLGTPVTVILEGETKEKNLLVPRDAVVRGNSGLLVVWVHEAPETFRPQIVDAEPFDGTSMKIKAGLNEGDRFVTEGASFLSQVR